MTWFKLDDGFHCHPKVLEAGNEAVGFYVRCGSWVSQQLTNGFVPKSIALLYGTRKLVDLLVEVKLWVPVDGGWQMHDYLAYNPSRDQVQADREAAAERQKRAREKAKANRGTKDKDQDSHGVTNGVTHGVTTPVSHADVTPVVTVPPTRPDPTHVVPSGTTSAPNGAARIDGEPITAQTLLGEYLDACKVRPPQRFVGQLSKEIKTLVDEGIAVEHIRDGLAKARAKGLHPASLSSAVAEAMNAGPPQARAVNGHTAPVLDRRQQATNDLFDRAMQRALAKDAAEGGAPWNTPNA